MNAFRLAAYTSGYTKVGRALPSNFGGMAGKIYDGAILKKGFYENGPGQNVLGITNDAAAFIFGGGSNMSSILYPSTNAQFYRSASSYGIFVYDNMKLTWQNKK